VLQQPQQVIALLGQALIEQGVGHASLARYWVLKRSLAPTSFGWMVLLWPVLDLLPAYRFHQMVLFEVEAEQRLQRQFRPMNLLLH